MDDEFDGAGIGHNSVDPTTAAQLRQFVERIERLNAEIKDIQDDRKDVYAELKSVGFDAPTVRRIVKMREMDAEKRIEAEALLETYAIAMGLM